MSTPSRAHAVSGAVASAGGSLLALATRVAAVRPSAKPLHPRGRVVTGHLVGHGGHRTGVPLIDDPAEWSVLVRTSRAVGLPAPLPDIHGIALRLPGPADLLFAQTGLGTLTRYTLTASSRPDGRPLTTLLPYRSPSGSLLLGLRPLDDDSFDLLWAHTTGPWQTWGRLSLDEARDADPVVDFDPLLHQPVGLENHDWVRRLREPAYRTARRTRGHEGPRADPE